MKTLKESLFDTDLASKDPILTQWIKDKVKKERGDLFAQLHLLYDTLDPEMLPDWVTRDYRDHQPTYDWIIAGLWDAFKKQNFCSWFNIWPDEVEKGYERLYDKDSLDDFSEKLEQFFKKAEKTQKDGEFVLHHGQLPDFFIEYLKEIVASGYHRFDNKYTQIHDWGIMFYDYNGAQNFSFYGCPKGLDPKIKKLLYN